MSDHRRLVLPPRLTALANRIGPATEGAGADTEAQEPRRREVAPRDARDQRLEQLVAGQGLAVGHTTEILSLIRAQGVNGVLESGTRTIPASGFLERKYQVPFAGIMILNPGGPLTGPTGPMIVQEGASTAFAQGDGPGSFIVPANSAVTMPLAGTAFTVFGSPGARFTYCTLARCPEPSAAIGTNAGASDLPETSTVLAAAGSATGATHSTVGYSKLRAFASSDQAGTLNIQQARLAAGPWYTTTSVAVAAGAGAGTILESILALPFVRAQYVNGATLQGLFEFDSALVTI